MEEGEHAGMSGDDMRRVLVGKTSSREREEKKRWQNIDYFCLTSLR